METWRRVSKEEVRWKLGGEVLKKSLDGNLEERLNGSLEERF